MDRSYTVESGIIILSRELTELDAFVKDFVDILKKHSDYLIVSGYVSIVSGRTRGTEDVDVLVPKPQKNAFGKLFDELVQKGFWCYQGDRLEEIFPYISEGTNIRFAKNGQMFPNIEFVPVDDTKPLQQFEMRHFQKMRLGGFEFKIPMLEFEILYKEIVLGSEKDIADAQHLRAFFNACLKEENFNKAKHLITQHESNKGT